MIRTPTIPADFFVKANARVGALLRRVGRMTIDELREYVRCGGVCPDIPVRGGAIQFGVPFTFRNVVPLEIISADDDVDDSDIIWLHQPLHDPEWEADEMVARIAREYVSQWITNRYGPRPLFAATDEDLEEAIAAWDDQCDGGVGVKSLEVYRDPKLLRYVVLGELAARERMAREGESNHDRMKRLAIHAEHQKQEASA